MVGLFPRSVSRIKAGPFPDLGLLFLDSFPYGPVSVDNFTVCQSQQVSESPVAWSVCSFLCCHERLGPRGGGGSRPSQGCCS
jgi:hypothetical protein